VFVFVLSFEEFCAFGCGAFGMCMYMQVYVQVCVHVHMFVCMYMYVGVCVWMNE